MIVSNGVVYTLFDDLGSVPYSPDSVDSAASQGGQGSNNSTFNCTGAAGLDTRIGEMSSSLSSSGFTLDETVIVDALKSLTSELETYLNEGSKTESKTPRNFVTPKEVNAVQERR
uniref:Bzip transcription factor n=1 Tax=Syphacia muris TaxID=451379 RepID=A0A0N5AKZ2_9BILA